MRYRCKALRRLRVRLTHRERAYFESGGAFLTQRNPFASGAKHASAIPGFSPSRYAERAASAFAFHDPPRKARCLPSLGPRGFLCSSLGYLSKTSLHHSATFPCMSNNPHGFAFFCPTGCVFLPALSTNQP